MKKRTAFCVCRASGVLPVKPRQWAGKGLGKLHVRFGDRVLVFAYLFPHGFVPVELQAVKAFNVTTVCSFTWRPLPMKRVKSITHEGGKAPAHLANPESKLLLRFPHLLAFLSATAYDDAAPRRPGWVTVKTEGASWKIQAKDPDSGMQLQVTAQSLDDAITGLNLLLGSEDAPWEVDPWARERKAKKKGG